jgi:hypothetical protein
MIKYAREQFFINANDMLDKNGKSNPKYYWKLVKKLCSVGSYTYVEEKGNYFVLPVYGVDL